MTNPQRDLWMPYYDSTEATAFGDGWPVWIVARWERNGIGETRFTGETRVYVALDPEAIAKALPDWMVEHPMGKSENELRLIIAQNIIDRLKVAP